MALVVIFLLSCLHLISALFPTFYERKSGIFRFIEDKRSLFGNWSWVSFLRISYSFKFLALLQFSLACLGVICRIYVCTSKINFQCVDFFVFFWCWYSVVFYTFVSFPVKINWFSINDIVTLRGNFFFSFLHLISTPFPTVDKREGGIFQVSRGQEKIRRRYFCSMFISSSLWSSSLSHCSSFFSFIFGCCLLTAFMY